MWGRQPKWSGLWVGLVFHSVHVCAHFFDFVSICAEERIEATYCTSYGATESSRLAFSQFQREWSSFFLY